MLDNSVLKLIQNAHIKLRIDSQKNWDKYNPVLFEGELGFINDDDTFPVQFKVGDGHSKFSELKGVLSISKTLLHATNYEIIPLVSGACTWRIYCTDNFISNDCIVIIKDNTTKADVTCSITRTTDSDDQGNIIQVIDVGFNVDSSQLNDKGKFPAEKLEATIIRGIDA